MYRDLERPEIAAHPLVRALLGADPPPRFAPFADDADIDALIPVERLDFALDSDGSQTLAAEAVRRGASVVIQGPPGTGKSQVITNLIAQAVLDGRTVLFVAEKLAALEVVQRRLAGVGLGAACLALHSDGANRRALLAELDATLKAPRPAPPDREAVIRPLGALRGRLNRHAAAMHAPIGTTGWTAFRAIGEVARLKQAGMRPPELRLDASGWTAAQIRDAQRLARELAATVQRIGLPARHPWRGVRAPALLPTDLDRIPARIPPALEAIAALRAAAGTNATRAGAQGRLAALRAAETFAAIRARVPGVRDSGWTAPGLEQARVELAKGGGFLRSFSGTYRAARETVAALFAGAPPDDPLPALDAVMEGQHLLRIAPEAATVTPDPGQAAALEAALARVGDTAEPLFAELALDRTEAFGGDDPPLGAIADRLAQWAAAPTALADWMTWARLATQASELGLDPVADRLADGRIQPEDAAAAFRFALAESLMAAAMRATPTLAAFDGPSFTRLVEEFRAADQARLALARAEAAAAHTARLRIAEGPDMLRAMAVLRGEIAKRSRHLPIRTLLARAGPAVQAIKPVFMMSPLSVAAFLDPAAVAFDMLVIDEASQIEPVDALGAVARCRQIVVVGDDRQMPPTRFFARLTGDDEQERADDETIAASDVESILSLCTARGFPNQMLRWHYRSRHESLIAVSNRSFYENRLLVIPSPRPRGSELGLSLVRVDGAFDTGGTGTNAVEAQAVAEAVLAHARQHPKDTLGVAAFSVRQRDAILDAVEALRRDNPDTEPFFAAHPHEPVFVKNLENVQGDERDVMFISVGYAKGPDGRLAMRFGPLSAEGGERRLNVLITRAKKRCVVFSGLTADDIDLARASGRGVAVLKDFLAFAAGGTVAAAQAGEDDAALTDAIATALEGAGAAVARRVGLAGLFVDVAVKDAEGYGLGILTDGDFYASARSARDRDRLQEGALAMMGWRLARSWAADWLVRPEAEARRLAALAGVAVEQQTPPEAAPAAHGLSAPYAPATVEVPTETPPDAMPFARLGGIVAAIVRAEGPIHADAVIARAAALWNIETPTAKQRAALAQALRLAKELEGLVAEGEFWRGEETTIVPRDRSALPASWRRPDWLPPAEIRAALLAALDTAEGGVDPQALDTAALRLLGMGEDARPAVAAQRALLTGEGRIALSAGLAVPASAARR
ncbi:AAA domain-containing protein [Elioraea sp.]|uniref:AAA domain-containing protein n=1 Tax=Elioraea sp. TaxID=2185103 RepID=UPI003F726E85